MWLTKGHDTAVELLRRSIENQHIAHAYMFSGPQHVGKMTLALDFARALTCKSENGPCNVCNSCQLIGAGKHPDVVIINLNLAGELSRRSPDEDASTRSKIGIAHIKDIQMLANLPAYSGEYKIFIFEEAQDLSIPAANRLLKILEEPPPNVIWILLTAEKYSILTTVLSRCQNIQLHPMSSSSLEKYLINELEIEEKQAHFLTRISKGRLGWALSALRRDDLLKGRKIG